MCGIVGIVSSDDVNQQIYDSLLLLQHRGQDSTGIATMENTVFHLHKAKGQVNTAYRTRDMRNLIGKIGLGHVRYATKGSAESVEEAQPFYVNAPYGIVLIHNGNLTNTRDLEKQLFNVDRRHTNSSSYTEMLLNVFATELQEQICNQELNPEIIFNSINCTSWYKDRLFWLFEKFLLIYSNFRFAMSNHPVFRSMMMFLQAYR